MMINPKEFENHSYVGEDGNVVRKKDVVEQIATLGDHGEVIIITNTLIIFTGSPNRAWVVFVEVGVHRRISLCEVREAFFVHESIVVISFHLVYSYEKL